MSVYLRYGMIAAALLGSVGLASAQSFPKGVPGNNDNVIVSPADRAIVESARPSASAPAAQAFPKGAPGSNDNMMVSVVGSDSSAAGTLVHKRKVRHAKVSHKQHAGT